MRFFIRNSKIKWVTDKESCKEHRQFRPDFGQLFFSFFSQHAGKKQGNTDTAEVKESFRDTMN